MRHHSRTTRWVDDQPFTQFPRILDGGPTCCVVEHANDEIDLTRRTSAQPPTGPQTAAVCGAARRQQRQNVERPAGTGSAAFASERWT
jgi:hypothetical protein